MSLKNSVDIDMILCSKCGQRKSLVKKSLLYISRYYPHHQVNCKVNKRLVQSFNVVRLVNQNKKYTKMISIVQNVEKYLVLFCH